MIGRPKLPFYFLTESPPPIAGGSPESEAAAAAESAQQGAGAQGGQANQASSNQAANAQANQANQSATNQAAPPPAAGVVTLTTDEYSTLLARRNVADQADAERTRLQNEANAAAVRAAADRGNIEEAMRLQAANHESALVSERNTRIAAEQRSQSLDQEVLDSHVRDVVTAALSTRTFVNPAALGQARTLLAAELAATRANGAVVVTQRGAAIPAAQHLDARLGSADFAHFLRAGHAGGAGAQGGQAAGASSQAGITPGTQRMFDATLASMNTNSTGVRFGMN